MTFPELFAVSLGVELRGGNRNCFWCGSACDESSPVRVTDTFWDHDVVAYPKSPYQCVGCVECLNEKRVIPGYDKPQKTRNHSWFASDSPRAEALNKSTLDRIRDICLCPPNGESWGLAIAESGQKHILFRTPVNAANSRIVSVQLELILVTFHPGELRTVLGTTIRIAAAIGKPSLGGPVRPELGYKLLMSGVDLHLVEQWNRQWNSPVSRLAAFLTPSKEECIAYLEEDDAKGVPPTVGGGDGRPVQRSLFE